MAWLKDAAQTWITVSNPNEVICDEPWHLNGRQWSNLSQDDMDPNTGPDVSTTDENVDQKPNRPTGEFHYSGVACKIYVVYQVL